MKRRWLVWLLFIAFVWVIVSRFTEIELLAQTLAQGRFEWLLLAALFQIGYYYCYTLLYQSALETVEVESHLREILPVVFAAIFMNVAAPVGGASGPALFVDDAKRRGRSGPRAAAGMLLAVICNEASFLVVLAVGVAYLFVRGDLYTYQIIGVIALLCLVMGLTSVLILGLWRPVWVRKMLSGVQRLLNHAASVLKRPPLLAEGWARETAHEFREAAVAITMHPLTLTKTLLIGLVAYAFDVASLYVVFYAFNQPTQIGTVIAGFAMGILFWIVSPTPQGIGVVEGVMALVYTSLGVPGAKATVVALAWRGLTFWLPFFVGFLCLRRTRSLR